jgi:hypothetical protein
MRYCRLCFAPLLVLLSAAPPSQAQAMTPLHAFFQQHFDSTIVYQSGSNWNNSPNYLILAKHHNRLDFFTYRSPYRDGLGHYFPGKLVQRFSREETHFRTIIPDTNRYLLPQRVTAERLLRGWQTLNEHQLWMIQGDEQARRTTGNCVVEDAEEITLYLLDKRASRSARFYAPAFFEACAGKGGGRQQVIRASSTLQALLQNAH